MAACWFARGRPKARLISRAWLALSVAIALTLDALVRPPIWVHVLLWVPLTAVAVVYGLRVGKGALLASEHQRQAAEGRRVDKGDD